jgi:hypothetical protein
MPSPASAAPAIDPELPAQLSMRTVLRITMMQRLWYAQTIWVLVISALVSTFPSYVVPERAQEDFETTLQVNDPALREQLLAKLMHEPKDAREAMLAVIAHSRLSAEEQSRLAALIPADTRE